MSVRGAVHAHVCVCIFCIDSHNLFGVCSSSWLGLGLVCGVCACVRAVHAVGGSCAVFCSNLFEDVCARVRMVQIDEKYNCRAAKMYKQVVFARILSLLSSSALLYAICRGFSLAV